MRAANLPPAFYCWGTRDGFARQFTQNSTAVSEAGCEVETHILQNYPHGYGTGGSADIWCNDFDSFLLRIMSQTTSMVGEVHISEFSRLAQFYDVSGRKVSQSDMRNGIYIMNDGIDSKKIAVGNM